MKRTQALRRARIGIMTALAVVVGALVPFAAPPAAQAAYGVMIQPATGYIVSRVADGCGGERPSHTGIDISHNGGTPIVAAYGGTVSTRTFSSGYGNYVVISHPSGYTTLYAHMASPGSVNPGQTVTKGQQIGVVGSTGNSTGAHLHFEIYRNGTNVANQGYTCKTNVTRGAAIPMDFPGLGGSSTGVNADYNGDGKADVLAVSTTGQMTAYNGNGNGGWATDTLGGGWGTTRALIHGDYNGDSKGDAIAVRDDGTLWFYRGVGGRGFQASQVGHGWGTMRLVTGGADFNSDGRADLVAIGNDANLYLYPGNGAGGFNGGAIQIGNGWGNFSMILAGDFGTDGKGDILARDTSGKLLLYPGNGSTLNNPYQVGHGWNTMTAITGGVDFGADGYADVLSRDEAGDLWLYPGLGGSGFGTRIKVGHGWNIHRLIA